MNRKEFIKEMVLKGNFNGDTLSLRLPDVLRIADKLFGKKEIKKCYWCKKFIGNAGRKSGGHDKNWYCNKCYEKGLEMENKAMGLR